MSSTDQQVLPQTTYTYGRPPVRMDSFDLSDEWHEYLHYLYLPVVMRSRDLALAEAQSGLRLPTRIEFLRPMIEAVLDRERIDPADSDHYVYVSARRGFAHPGNALNRPGWHADGFGSHDRNYVWSDRFPTRYALGDFGEVSTDHVISAAQFDFRIQWAAMHGIEVRECGTERLYRFDPSVVHATPDIPAPGGNRSFVKVSVSPSIYNLLGNSHNFLFDYAWRMWDRGEIRNDPIHGGGDSGPQA